MRVRSFSLPIVLTGLCLVGWQSRIEGGMSDDSLKSMLVGLKYDVRDVAKGNHEIEIKGSDLIVPIRIFLDRTETRVWFSSLVTQPDDVDRLSQKELREILKWNLEIGPTHFMIDGGCLKIKTAIDNRGLTPAILSREIDYFVRCVASSRKAWDKTPSDRSLLGKPPLQSALTNR